MSRTSFVLIPGAGGSAWYWPRVGKVGVIALGRLPISSPGGGSRSRTSRSSEAGSSGSRSGRRLERRWGGEEGGDGCRTAVQGDGRGARRESALSVPASVL